MMLTTVTFAIQMIGDHKQKYLNGYMWLNMSMTHIVGNLIKLWIFGSYIVSAGKDVPLIFYPALLIFFQNFRKSGDFLANRV